MQRRQRVGQAAPVPKLSCQFLEFHVIYKENTHSDKIERVSYNDRRSAAKPESRSHVFYCHAKRSSTTGIIPHDVLHTPQAFAYVLIGG